MNRSINWWLVATIVVFAFLFYYLSSTLTPFFIAALLAYLTDPFVNRLVAVKIPRTLAVVIAFAILILIILFSLFLVIPILEHQIITLINKIPIILTWLQNVALPWLSKRLGIEEVIDFPSVRSFITSHWQQVGSVASAIWTTITHSGHRLFVFLINLLLIPVVTFYLLRDWPKVVAGLLKLIPVAIKPTVIRLATECDEALSAFFRGQFLVMFSLGIYYAFALWLSGLEIALLMGIVIGLISIVPYLGFLVGITVAIIAQLVQYNDFWHLLYILIAFTVGHIIENYILYPLLVGDRIGLHPVAVIFAILAGGELFGFVGILFALPMAAIIMVLLRFMIRHYLQTDWYSQTRVERIHDR